MANVSPTCLVPELNGLGAHISVQDCTLDFASYLEPNRKYWNHTLASFVDIERAFNRVSMKTAVSCLGCLGLTGRVLTFFASYLSDRSCAVKLGAILSSTSTLRFFSRKAVHSAALREELTELSNRLAGAGLRLSSAKYKCIFLQGTHTTNANFLFILTTASYNKQVCCIS